jgi:hypothetical protein
MSRRKLHLLFDSGGIQDFDLSSSDSLNSSGLGMNITILEMAILIENGGDQKWKDSESFSVVMRELSGGVMV